MILIQYDGLWHYRQSLFEKLLESDSNIQLMVGKRSIYKNLKLFHLSEQYVRKVHFVRNFRLIPGSDFNWQLGSLLIFLRLKPQILVLKGVDPHIVSNLFLFLFIKMFSSSKVVFWGHGTLGKQGKMGKYLRLLFLKNADKLLVYDEAGKERLIANGVNKREIAVIGNCINDMTYKNSLETHTQRNRIIYSGRLYKKKKVDVLIKALAFCSSNGMDYHLDIVGNGDQMIFLKQLSIDYKVDHLVVFHGELYEKAVSELFLKAKLCVIPSSVGLAMYHALAHGVPVVTDNDYELHGPEISALIENETGFYYEKDDEVALAILLDKLMNQNTDHTENCLSYYDKHCTAVVVKENIIYALKSIM